MMKEKHVIKNSNTRYQISKQKLVLIIWVDIYTTEKMFETQKSSVKEMHNSVNETNIQFWIYEVWESLTQKWFKLINHRS